MPDPASAAPRLLVLSAAGPEALRDVCERVLIDLELRPQCDWGEICACAALDRVHLRHRLAIQASTLAEGKDRLHAFVRGAYAKGVAEGVAAEICDVAFIFTGQGSQYAGMGSALYRYEPVFRDVLDSCDATLRRVGALPLSLLEVMFAEPGSANAALIDTTAFAQPALFALELALASLWRSWGVVPKVLLGHSAGEYAAACVAGVMSPDDGVVLIARRAQLIEAVSAGSATAAVLANVADVAAALATFDHEVSLAGSNSPHETLIAGEAVSVASAAAELKRRGMDARILRIPHAAHSAMVDPVLNEFEAFAATLRFREPDMTLIANLTGTAQRTMGPDYWRAHLRSPVRLVESFETLSSLGCGAVVEIGPRPVLQLLGRQSWRGRPVKWLSSIWAIREERAQMLEALGELFVSGVDVDWGAPLGRACLAQIALL